MEGPFVRLAQKEYGRAPGKRDLDSKKMSWGTRIIRLPPMMNSDEQRGETRESLQDSSGRGERDYATVKSAGVNGGGLAPGYRILKSITQG